MPSPLGSAAVLGPIQLSSKLQLDAWNRINANLCRKSVNRSQNWGKNTLTDQVGRKVIRRNKVKHNWRMILTGHKKFGGELRTLGHGPIDGESLCSSPLQVHTWERMQKLQPRAQDDVGRVQSRARGQEVILHLALFLTVPTEKPASYSILWPQQEKFPHRSE